MSCVDRQRGGGGEGGGQCLGSTTPDLWQSENGGGKKTNRENPKNNGCYWSTQAEKMRDIISKTGAVEGIQSEDMENEAEQMYLKSPTQSNKLIIH